MSEVRLYHTPAQPCGYLEKRSARNLVVDPCSTDARLYQRLATRGFRRSGEYLYRPACDGCHACISLRLPVARFRPDRSMRRTLSQNQDLGMNLVPARVDHELYHLYRRYLQHRHPDGGMAEGDLEAFASFMLSSWCSTVFLEFRAENELIAVAVTDLLTDGLSAVYTFFSPDHLERSLGTLAVLKQIDLARQRGLDWLYLGYWIADCRKMAYKARFRPHQVLTRNGWREVG